MILIPNKKYKARNLTIELNIKVLVTHFSSNMLFKLTESLLLLLHGVRKVKILFKTFNFFKLKVPYWVLFAISKMGSAIFLACFAQKLLAKTFFQEIREV